MPNPKSYDNQNDWMDACMHHFRRNEGKKQDEAVSQCLFIWRNKSKKKNKKRSAEDFTTDVLASLKSDIKKSDKVKKVVVFLGGECPKGNEWREDIKKEFKDKIFFLDPYDESWKADENIYNELEGLLKADHVIFYKGGEGTKKEEKFLDSIGGGKYSTFNKLEDLKSYLNKVSKSIKKKVPISKTLRVMTSNLLKQAYPHVGSLDLCVEKMDKKSINDLKKDILDGNYINVDSRAQEAVKGVGSLHSFSGKDLLEQMPNSLLLKSFFENDTRFSTPHPYLRYDNKTHTIEPSEAGISIEHTYGPVPVNIKNAKLGQHYDFCSTQVDLPESVAREVISFGDKIPEEELYVEDDGGCGRENEIHVTLLYGLTEDNPEKVEKMLHGIKPFEISLGTITAFLDNDKHDVLKIDVDSPVLQRLHYILEDNLPNENSYPTYHPHVTIAYLKKGEAEKYIGKDDFRGKKFITNEIVFSSKSGDKIPIRLEK